LEHFAGFEKPVERLIFSFCTRTHTTTDLIFLDFPQRPFEISMFTSTKADPGELY